MKKSAFESGVGWGVKIEEMGVLDFRVEGGKLRCRMSCGGNGVGEYFFYKGFLKGFFYLEAGCNCRGHG